MAKRRSPQSKDMVCIAKDGVIKRVKRWVAERMVGSDGWDFANRAEWRNYEGK